MLKRSLGKGLLFQKSEEFKLEACINAEQVDSKVDRKSTIQRKFGHLKE